MKGRKIKGRGEGGGGRNVEKEIYGVIKERKVLVERARTDLGVSMCVFVCENVCETERKKVAENINRKR